MMKRRGNKVKESYRWGGGGKGHLRGERKGGRKNLLTRKGGKMEKGEYV